MEITGAVKPSPAQGQALEVEASDVKVIGWVDEPESYPMAKRHSLEFLREHAHLRARTNVIGAVARA